MLALMSSYENCIKEAITEFNGEHDNNTGEKMSVKPQLKLQFNSKPFMPGSLPKVQLPSRLQPPPSGETITQLSYVKMFISGKLVFPPCTKEHQFTSDNLEDLGSIGHGMFGNVFKMRHKDTDTLMAVKRVRILSNSDQGSNHGSLRRIQTEVDAIKAASKCPEVVQFYGVTFYEGDCWVCMELMDASLEDIYKAVHEQMHLKFFDEMVLGGIAVSTIKALDHLKQNHHIIHRDVKPSNILLNKEGEIKLCDFGISGYLVDSVAQTTDVGCRPYMAPERLQATSQGYDIRSDVWSLGITMVEVCTGEFPYKDFTEKPLFAQLKMVVHGDAPILQNANYSSQTIIFVNSCLTKDCANRPDFQSLKETEYFRKYTNMPEMKGHVAEFVQKVLPHIPKKE